MASIISAGTTSATALNMSADTSGVLQLASNNGTVGATLNASQNFGIGTSSPIFGLIVEKDNGSGYVAGFRSNNSSPYLTIQTTGGITQIQALNSSASSTADLAMQISGGRLLVGTGSPGSGANLNSKIITGNISISGADGELLLNNTGADARTWRILSATSGGATARLRFYDDNAGAERMGITKTGEVLIGTTTSAINSEILAIQNGGGGSVAMRIQRGGSNPAYIGTDNTNIFSIWDSGIVQRFVVTSAGSCQNTTGSYGTISDAKLKENIVDATPKLDDLMKLKVRNYGLKSEPNSKFIGFIAQELQEVFPGMIETFEDEDEHGEKTGEVTLGIKTTVLIPMLVKALQELNDKVTALEVK